MDVFDLSSSLYERFFILLIYTHHDKFYIFKYFCDITKDPKHFFMEPQTFYMNHNTLVLMYHIILENMDRILKNSK